MFALSVSGLVCWIGMASLLGKECGYARLGAYPP